jgi:hypothetical protein
MRFEQHPQALVRAGKRRVAHGAAQDSETVFKNIFGDGPIEEIFLATVQRPESQETSYVQRSGCVRSEVCMRVAKCQSHTEGAASNGVS